MKESKKSLLTTINQSEVTILSPEDFKGYEKNKPGKNWELIEYRGNKVWIPIHSHTLTTPKIDDYSKVTMLS